MSKGTRILTIALLLSVFCAGTALAQDAPPSVCDILDAVDCELLMAAQQAMQTATSATVRTEVNVMLDNIPAVPFDELAFRVVGESTTEAAPETIRALRRLGAQVVDGRMLSMADPHAFMAQYAELLADIPQDSKLTIEIPEEIAGIAAAEAGFGIPSSWSLGMRQVDGVVYLNISQLADALPGLVVTGDIWLGMDLGDALGLALESGELEQIPDQQTLPMMQMMAASISLVEGPFLTTVAASTSAEILLPYVQVERLPDSRLGGSQVTVFRTTMDYAGLMADPGVKDWLAAVLSQEELIGQELGEAEIEQAIMMAEMLGPMLLETMNMEVIESIDPETSYVVEGQFRMNWDTSQMGPLMALAGEEGPSADEAMPVITVEVTERYEGINEPVDLAAPEPAIVVVPDELMMLAQMQ